MKNYTAEQLSANYDKFIDALKKVFKGERLKKLLLFRSMKYRQNTFFLIWTKNYHNRTFQINNFQNLLEKK